MVVAASEPTLESSLGRVFVALRREVPPPPMDEAGEESWGIAASDDRCVLGDSEELEARTLRAVHESSVLGFLEENEQPLRVAKVLAENMAKRWRR